MSFEKSKLPFIGTKERYKKWETEPVTAINMLKELGLPSLQKIEGKELTPEKAVDIDGRALESINYPNIIFGRPHAGEFIPEGYWERTTEEGRRTMALVDRGTDMIFRSGEIPSVGTKITRFLVDPNRAPLLDMDSKNSRVPGKVLWYKGVSDEAIYKEGQEPTREEVADLVERFYLPYYNGMLKIVGALTDRKKNTDERILVIDGHSFPISANFKSYFEKYGLKDPENLPLFILGDSDGTTCDSDIQEAFILALKNNFSQLETKTREDLLGAIKGGLIGINKPFKGVHNVHFYGQREQGVNCIQLECNETAYVNTKEGDYYNAEYNFGNMGQIQKLLEKTCKDIAPILKARA